MNRWALALLLAAAAAAARAQAPSPDADPWAPVKKAFAAGTDIPETVFEGPDAKVYDLAKKISSGCVQPCQTEKYRKNIALVCKVLKLADVAKVQAVYCPGEPAVCRARKAAAAGAVAGTDGGKPATEGGKRGLAAKKVSTAIAKALAQNKTDALAGPPAGAPVILASAVTAPAPPVATPPPAPKAAPKSAAPPPGDPVPAATPAPAPGGFVRRLLDKVLPDKKQQTALARAESTDKVAEAAENLLARLPGAAAKALAERFGKAAALEDAAARAEAQRALITEADAVFQEILDRRVETAVKLARQEACKAKKGKALKRCMAEKVTEAELTAARDSVFTAAPELGLYFVGRSEHQLFIKDKMAAGELWTGLRLEPWELGVTVPDRTKITIASDNDDEAGGGEGGKPFLGLSFELEDGSKRFEGERPVKDGVERIKTAEGTGGERVRSVMTVKPGKQGDVVLKSEALYYAPGGRLVRSETTSGSGSHVEIKDYNLKGKEKELRRYEIRDRKGGKERVEVRDPDSLRNTVTDYDGSVTITSRREKGLPVDPKQPDGSKWLQQRGRMVKGRFQLEEIQLEDKSVLKGSSKTGRFVVTDIEEPGGRKLHGKTDPKSGRFQPESVVEKDGSGQRKYGRVMITLGPGGKPLRYLVPLAQEPVKRDNALAIADEFAGAAGLDESRVGPLGEWLYDRMTRVTYEKEGPGVRGAVLAAEKPSKSVVFLLIKHVVELDPNDETIATGKEHDEAGHQTIGQWEQATAYQGEKAATILRAVDDQGVPQREYVAEDKMRQWFKGYSNEGGAGLLTSSDESEHLFLVQFHRDPKNPRRWISACGDENDGTVDDPKAKCGERDQVGKPHVINTTGSGMSDLASTLGDIPGIKQATKYATKGYYTAIGYIQDDIGFDTSGDMDKRLAVIANKYRGAVSKQSTLEELASDPELLKEVDEKVVEKRKKDHHDECVRLGDGCDEYMRGLNCPNGKSKKPCATKEERLAIVEYAYSPSHAIDYASQGGSKFLYVLGGLGQAGEMAAASLPVMGLTEGLGALGKLKYVGGAFNFANGAMGTFMTAGWVVGGVANGGELVDGIRNGDMAKIVKSGVQAGGDLVMAYKGHADGKARAAKKAEVERSLANERERLRKIESLPDTGYSTVQLDLHKASPADLVKYREALKEMGIPEPKAEHGIVEMELSPRKKWKLDEALKGTPIESIDFVETGKRQDERSPFTGDEVDAMFAEHAALNDAVKLDLSEFPPKDWKKLRTAIKELGGKWADPNSSGIVEISLPHGKGAELMQRMKGEPIKLLSVDEAAKIDRIQREERVASGEGEEAGEAAPHMTVKEIDSLWEAKNGANLTSPETVKAERKAAFKAAVDPKLSKAVKAAEKAGDIAPTSWQGQQGGESNCVPHALANASNGAFTLAETVAAGKAAGADYSKSGTSETQLIQMMSKLENDAAANGREVDYRPVDPGEYFKEQAEAVAAGKPRQAAVAIIRTGGGAADPHALHAVALRGQIVVEGQHYIVVTDSHLNAPLLYTPEAFSAAVVSNGVIMIDAAPAK